MRNRLAAINNQIDSEPLLNLRDRHISNRISREEEQLNQEIRVAAAAYYREAQNDGEMESQTGLRQHAQ